MPLPLAESTLESHKDVPAQAEPRVVFRGSTTFFQTLRERVDAHFAGKPRRDDPALYRKTALIAVWWGSSYLGCLLTSGPMQALSLASHALAACALGFNVFHDAIHGSYSASEAVNARLARLTCCMLGVSRKLWWFKHNVLHHRFTNIYKWDDDLETRDSLRMSPRQPWKAKYQGQHLFFIFLYSLTTIEWVLVKDYVQYFTLKINPFQPIPEFSRAEKVEFWLSKAAYYGYQLALPLLLLPVWKVVAGFVAFHMTLSVVLALIFNLAHAMEMADFPVPEPGTGNIEEEWAAHQLRTTVNFARRSRSLNWFAGGLNFQIEHHLFPQVSHTHYPALSELVRKTALEYELPYNDYPTYAAAFKSHVRLLKELGRRPSAA